MSARAASLAALLGLLAAVPARAACRGAKELETPIQLTIVFAGGRAPVSEVLAYAGCERGEASDFMPAYSERRYRSAGGFALTVITDDGDASSEVLLTQGRAPVGRFGFIANAALASGDPVAVGEVTLRADGAPVKGRATLRGASAPATVAEAAPR